MSLADDLRTLAPRLRAHAVIISNGAVDADDLVQETFLRAWEFRHTYREDGDLKAWLLGILRTVHRASVAAAQDPVPDTEARFTAHLAHEPDQEWRASCAQLLDLLAGLPPHYREALMLVAGSGLSYEEAAEVCEVSVGTIKSRVSRARDALGRMAGNPFQTPETVAPPAPPAWLRPDWRPPVEGPTV